MRMIRTGFPLDDTGKPTGHKQQIADTISAIKKEAVKKAGLSETDRLRFLTLEAEFYQQCGRHVESARVLEPTRNHRLLRQKIWALLHYVFYHFYHVTGQHKRALEHLLKIEEIIQRELKTDDRQPFGTPAICHYFMGLCYRVNCGFAEAEHRMLNAQRYTHDRAIRELMRTDIPPERKEV